MSRYRIDRKIPSLLYAATALFLCHAATVSAEEPSRLVVLEKATVASPGVVSIDLGYDASVGAGFNTGIRIGLTGGELQINRSDRPTGNPPVIAYSTTIGYKKAIDENLAAFGEFGLIDREQNDVETDDATSLVLGIAYSLQSTTELGVDLNAALVSLDDSGLEDETVIVLGAGAQYAISEDQPGNIYLLGEFLTDDSSDTDPIFLLGVRWAIKQNVTIDFNFLENRGDAEQTTAIPGSIEVNLEF